MRSAECGVQNEIADGSQDSALCIFYFALSKSVNAKQLAQPAFQVGPNRCKSDHGCQFLKVICPRSSVRLERHRAKVEVAGASPAVDAILPLCLSSHRTSFVNSYLSVRV